jgi:hypothetical protein
MTAIQKLSIHLLQQEYNNDDYTWNNEELCREEKMRINNLVHRDSAVFLKWLAV